ncbi:hypothetical protein JX266_010904 [Neoarthrinium moseri]|nr:hypothetical protein JX266_010904 [Neoarthrinium moseri]
MLRAYLQYLKQLQSSSCRLLFLASARRGARRGAHSVWAGPTATPPMYSPRILVCRPKLNATLSIQRRAIRLFQKRKTTIQHTPKNPNTTRTSSSHLHLFYLPSGLHYLCTLVGKANSHHGPMATTDALLSAVEANNLDELKSLLEQLDGPLSNNVTLHEVLDKAVELSRFEIAEELFKRGVTWGDATIESVVAGGNEANGWNTKAIDLALAYGWDINTHYDHVGSPLVHCASMGKNSAAIISHLLSKGADPNGTTQMSLNPLEWACQHGDLDVVKVLLAHGARAKDTWALREASEAGKLEIMKLLVSRGADINGRPDETYVTPCYLEDDSWGWPLHGAVGSGSAECVKFLLDNGALTDGKNPKGLTPLDLARKRGNEEIIRLLEKKS